MMKIRTIILDDHAGFRRVLKRVFDHYPFIDVVAEAETGEEAIRQIEALSPDLVTVDINLPGMNGFEFTRILGKEHPAVGVIIISVNGHPAYYEESRQLRCPYVPKELLLEKLPGVLEGLAEDRRKVDYQ